MLPDSLLKTLDALHAPMEIYMQIYSEHAHVEHAAYRSIGILRNEQAGVPDPLSGNPVMQWLSGDSSTAW
jgi:hypothetical protein